MLNKVVKSIYIKTTIKDLIVKKAIIREIRDIHYLIDLYD